MNMQPPTGTPCAECPWRRTSAPGWLGPHAAHEWLSLAHSDRQIACHLTIVTDDVVMEDTRQCSGAAIYRRNVAKSPRDPAIVELPADTDRVFASPPQFMDHHGPT